MLNLVNVLDCGIEIDPIVPAFTSGVVTILKILIPIILIAFGMIDLARAVMTNDDKVMKEAQTKLIKRIIYAVIIFFVVAIVQFVFGLLAKASKESTQGGEIEKSKVSECISCFINGDNCWKDTSE